MNRSSVGSIDRAVEHLLIVDELRAGPRNALDDEIELVGRPLDAVVVDRHAQVLAAAGLARLEPQHLAARGHLERRARRAIRHAHDDGGLTAVPEEMLHGQRHEAEETVGPPKMRLNSSKPLTTTGSFNGPRSVRPMNATTVGATIGMTSAPSRGVARAGAEVERFGRHSARVSEKRLHDSRRRRRLQHRQCQRVVTSAAFGARAETNESARHRR